MPPDKNSRHNPYYFLRLLPLSLSRSPLLSPPACLFRPSFAVFNSSPKPNGSSAVGSFSNWTGPSRRLPDVPAASAPSKPRSGTNLKRKKSQNRDPSGYVMNNSSPLSTDQLVQIVAVNIFVQILAGAIDRLCDAFVLSPWLVVDGVCLIVQSAARIQALERNRNE